MSNRMRQVTREEYEVLTRFHPGEIRYYVDFDRVTSRRTVGTKVKVRRGGARNTRKSLKTLSTGKKRKVVPQNSPVRLTTQRLDIEPNTTLDDVYEGVKTALNNDPTAVMGRSDLCARVTNIVPHDRQRVNWAVKAIMERGGIEYQDPKLRG